MEPSAIQKRVDTIRSHIAKKQLKRALDGDRELLEIQHNWVFSEKLTELDTHYRYMLHYLIEGEKDPDREAIYDKLTRDIYTLAVDVSDGLLARNSSSFFFEKTRMQDPGKPGRPGEHGARPLLYRVCFPERPCSR